jgi:hypothetical protein
MRDFLSGYDKFTVTSTAKKFRLGAIDAEGFNPFALTESSCRPKARLRSVYSPTGQTSVSVRFHGTELDFFAALASGAQPVKR